MKDTFSEMKTGEYFKRRKTVKKLVDLYWSQPPRELPRFSFNPTLLDEEYQG